MAPSLLASLSIFSGGILVGVTTTAYLSSPPPKPKQQLGEVTIVEPGSRGGGGGLAAILSEGGFRAAKSGEVWKFGNHPASTSDVLIRQAYITGYDRRLQHPAWTAEHLTLSTLYPPKQPSIPGSSAGGTEVGVNRSKSRFEEDESIPELWRAKLKDYFKSGYDRGHMVPAADAKISQQAMDETFLLSNIAPQIGDGFNRHYWAYFENFARKLTNEFTDVYVFTVPLYLPTKSSVDGKWRVTYEVIGQGPGTPSISVPTHFSKIILTSRVPKGQNPLTSTAPREISMAGFVLPNAVIPDEVPLEGFLVPVEQIEKSSGLSLVSADLKRTALPLCRETSCQLVVRRFDDTRKKLEAGAGGKPLSGGGRA